MILSENQKDFTASVDSLTSMILKGDTLQAMELFYSDTVVMQENEESPRIGKTTCLEHERKNLKRIKSMEAKLISQAINESKRTVFSEWQYLFTTRDDKKIRLTEVSVQQWMNGLVVREKFYYKEFTPY
jgi:hypothetical protein